MVSARQSINKKLKFSKQLGIQQHCIITCTTNVINICSDVNSTRYNNSSGGWRVSFCRRACRFIVAVFVAVAMFLIRPLSSRIAGTTGAVVTCPLEVVKTRLQSSNPVFGSDAVHSASPHYNNGAINGSSRHGSSYRSYHGRDRKSVV